MPQDDGRTRNFRPLVDSQLLEEIELLADVIAEASQFLGRLSTAEVDAVLGVISDSERRCHTPITWIFRGSVADGGAPSGA